MSAEPAAAAPPAAAPTAGGLLRQAREDAGVALSALAATMKLPEARLQALEDDDHAAFADHVLMRALAQSLCRALHIDPAPVLERLPRPASKSLVVHGSHIKPVPVKTQSFQGFESEEPKKRWRWLWLALLFVLALAALLHFMPTPPGQDGVVSGLELPAEPLPLSGRPDFVVEQTVPPAVLHPMPQEQPQPLAVPVPPALMLPQTPAASAEAPPAPAAPGDAAPADSAAVPEAPPPPADNAAPAPAPPAETPPGAASTTLRFQASAGAWLQVKDAREQTLVAKNLAANETLDVDGVDDSALPLSVVLGNSAAVQVWLRGQPLDLKSAARIRDGVARFAVAAP